MQTISRGGGFLLLLGESAQKNDNPHGGIFMPCVEIEELFSNCALSPSLRRVVFSETKQSETQPYGFLCKLGLL